MKFTVTWTPEAEAELARIWLAATDRNAVTDVANFIEASLRLDPYLLGESRDEGDRVIILPPLGVSLSVRDEDYLVQVWGIWLTQRKKR